jgi:hypothetical protein
MRQNFWWWLFGAGAVLWAVNKNRAEAQTRKEGNLAVSISWKPGTNTMVAVNNSLNALLKVLTVCEGFPSIVGAVQAPAVSGSVANSIFTALWTHDTMGPIKESVRVCTLKALQALDANITDFQASRIS